jgi:hypothetical protein
MDPAHLKDGSGWFRRPMGLIIRVGCDKGNIFFESAHSGNRLFLNEYTQDDGEKCDHKHHMNFLTFFETKEKDSPSDKNQNTN